MYKLWFSEAISYMKTTHKREDIINATIKLMSTQGYHATSMAQIIKEASVGAGTLYNYFKSKDILINEIVIQIKKELSETLEKSHKYTEDFDYNLKHMWYSIWEHTFSNRNRSYFAEIFIRSQLMTPQTFQQIYQDFSFSVKFLAVSMEKKYIDNMPLDVLESHIFGPIYHLLKLNMTQISSQPELQKEQMFKMFYKSVVLPHK